MIWRFLETGLRSGAENMAVDEALAADLRDNGGPPILRFYGWSPHAVSIGRHQSMEDFDRASLHRAGIDLVRRPTGGKAILHARELTYSVVVPWADRGLRDIYCTINTGLLHGLRLMGVDAELTKEGSDFRKLYEDPASVACFSGAARSEIRVGGKKLAGSAQRRYGNVVLQHGSLLLDKSHRELSRYLSPARFADGSPIRQLLEESTIDLGTILGRPVSFGETVEAVKDGCAKAWDAEFTTTEAFTGITAFATV